MKIKKLFKDYLYIGIIAVAVIVVHLVTMSKFDTVSWDAAVYVGMGKYLFSHGTIGTWEALRPVGLPVILGALWKLGINPYIAGMVFSTIMSTGVLFLVYILGERVRKGAGLIAAVLLGASSIFFMFSDVPVTDITATFFALLSLMYVYSATKNKQYFIGGIFAALAFLFRFPQGLMLVVGALIIFTKLFLEKGKLDARLERMIERGFIFAGGFFALAVPFLAVNYYAYGNAFLPFLEGTAVIKLYPSMYQKGIWFYPLGLLKQNPLFVLFLLPIAMYWKKSYRHIVVSALSIATIVVGSYFMYEGHKELRYMLAFLPYIAILSGIGIMYILEWYKLPLIAFFGLFGIVAFMAYAPYALQGSHYVDGGPDLYRFNTFLANAPKARVLTTTPFLLAYTDAYLTRNLYSDWNDAYKAYGVLRDTNDYILLNSCNLEIGCADNAQCKDKKEALLSLLEQQDTKVYGVTTPSQCQLAIYKIQH